MSGLWPRAWLFVGREDELARLEQGWAQARQGMRQVVVIAGEPGIGKTALIDTFVAQVAAAEDLWVGHGQCIEPYGPGEPYHREQAHAELTAAIDMYPAMDMICRLRRAEGALTRIQRR